MGNAVGSMLREAARFDNNFSFQWYNLLAIFGLHHLYLIAYRKLWQTYFNRRVQSYLHNSKLVNKFVCINSAYTNR